MQFAQFIKEVHEPDFFDRYATIYFCGSEYPYLFFMLLNARLRQQKKYFFETIDLQSHALQSVMSKLEMTFLGGQSIYWLRNLEALETKLAKSLRAYIENYRGEHRLLLFITKKDQIGVGQGQLIVDLPELVDKELFMKIAALEGEVSTHAKQIMSACYSSGIKLTLDNVYMLTRYINVVGTSQHEFVSNWLLLLVEPDRTLFMLSTYFFSKESKKFFAEWVRVKDAYSEQFWSVFWSEQLWRAAHVLDCIQRKNVVEAKKVSFRLPFSFMQRDWKKVSLEELQRAHHFVYTLDAHIKNGGGNFGFELLYLKFFTGY